MDNKNSSTNVGNKIYVIVSLVVFLIIMVLGTIFIGFALNHFDSPQALKAYIDTFGIWGRLIFLSLEFLQIVFALIPGEIIEVGAGYIFGVFQGVILTELGVIIASTLVFALVKRFGTKAARLFVSDEKISKLKFLKNEGHLEFIIFILYFIPGLPKDVFTYFFGLTVVSTKKFVIITTIARFPAILCSALAGANIMSGNYMLSLIIFIVLGVISIAGLIFYNWYIKNKNTETDII